MSKNVAVFVDVANLYYSARGQDTDVDYVALLKAATKGRDLIRAYAYSGLDPENENQRKFIDFLNKNGYKVVHKDIRKFGDGRVKANLDIELVVDLFRLADRMDIAVVVSGDGDFAPAIRALQDKGVRCEVISFRPNTSSDLIAVADEFFDIMKITGIGRGSRDKEVKATKSMSAPEMPAKEVVPEFGFREASPSVAAAALAALREGHDGREGRDGREAGARGRGRGRSRTAKAEAPPAADAEAETTAPAPAPAPAGNGAAEAAEGEHRRRRRRGGRGRGRGRSRAGHAGGEAASVEPTEPGWVELDDISQIEGLDEGVGMGRDEEHEYSFEEADAETLAELGLLEGTPEAEALAEPAEHAAVVEETEPKPRRRSRTKAAPEAPAEEKAAPRRRSRAKATVEADGPEAAPAAGSTAADEKPAPKRRSRAKAPASQPAADEAEKPARRRSTRVKPAVDASAVEAGQGEGIWKRFRSARGDGQGS
ncbi:MAG TPA: NYN domain-containing protein [Candidatus Limnocylindria bacterium]